jgi:drug/metabolite transporter (DMT)-like permease
MPVPGGRRYLPSTAVFLTELSKLAVCLTVALYEVATTAPRSTPATSLFGTLTSAVFTGDSWKMAVPASLYTLANSLQYVGISNLDAATFQVTYQLKIIVTAIFSVTILRKNLSPRKWTALILLMIGVAIVSIPNATTGGLEPGGHSRIYLPRSLDSLREHFLDVSDIPLAKRSATYEGIAEDEMALNHQRVSASIGLLSVIGVCVCSGLAGVYFEKVIKDAPKVTSLWIRNVQLSVYSLIPALFIGVVFLDGETVAKYGFFDGYNGIVVVSILLQAFGGIVAAFCIFYADNISKNFATSISMVLSSLASFFFFDFEATGNVGQCHSYFADSVLIEAVCDWNIGCAFRYLPLQRSRAQQTSTASYSNTHLRKDNNRSRSGRGQWQRPFHQAANNAP